LVGYQYELLQQIGFDYGGGCSASFQITAKEFMLPPDPVFLIKTNPINLYYNYGQ